MVLLLNFYAISILFLVQPPDQPKLWTSIFRNMMEAAWGARARGNLSAAHPTDLRPRGACAFRSKNSSHRIRIWIRNTAV
jgi:hypothetical protein